MRALDKIYISSAVIVLGAIAIGSYLDPTKTDFTIGERKRDHSIEMIIDNNWGIILTNNPSLFSDTYNTPETRDQQDNRICLFSPERHIPYTQDPNLLKEGIRPLLEDCLRKEE